jgi:hypothetical protein
MPDYRTTLYWAPELKSDVKGKTQFSFYTSDVPGKYVMVTEGLSAKGQAGSQIRYFDVKN